jgi:hypothetical protein
LSERLERGGVGGPFTQNLGWEGDHKPEYQLEKCFIGNCQVCKAEKVIIYNLHKNDPVTKFLGLTDEVNLVCSKCLMEAKQKMNLSQQTALGGKIEALGREREVTSDYQQKTRNEPTTFVQDPFRKPKTMLTEPTIFVWDQYDIYHRKLLMITADDTRSEITDKDWKKLQTPNGQLGSHWNCQLWTGLYHEFPKALDLATHVRDHWGIDVEIIRNAGNAMIDVIALFDIRKFEKLSKDIKTYSKEKMGDD